MRSTFTPLWRKVAAVFFFVFVVAVLTNVRGGSPGGECCNLEDQEGCSGCKPGGIGWVNIGTNVIYHCQTYTAPLVCEEDPMKICFQGQTALYVDECMTPSGGTVNYILRKKHCDYDSCD